MNDPKVTVTGSGVNTNPADIVWGHPAPLLTVPPQWGRITFDPDAMDLDGIGAAHSTRGRVVRAFFWLLRFWP